jgi:ribonuclease HI
MNVIEAYIDGSCRGNPGPGGYGAVFIIKNEVHGHINPKIHEIGGHKEHTTNNQMELQAVIAAIKEASGFLEADSSHILEIKSDSAYVVKGITEWIAGWKRKGWVTAGKSPVLNRELWEQIDALMEQYGRQIKISKVAGHAGVLHNERADEIATAFADKADIGLSRGSSFF